MSPDGKYGRKQMDILKLIEANIPQEHWPYCYIAPDGTVFAPRTDDEGMILNSGEELYLEWQENQGKTHVEGEPNLQQQLEQLQAQLQELQRLLGQQAG